MRCHRPWTPAWASSQRGVGTHLHLFQFHAEHSVVSLPNHKAATDAREGFGSKSCTVCVSRVAGVNGDTGCSDGPSPSTLPAHLTHRAQPYYDRACPGAAPLLEHALHALRTSTQQHQPPHMEGSSLAAATELSERLHQPWPGLHTPYCTVPTSLALDLFPVSFPALTLPLCPACPPSRYRLFPP